MKKKWITTLMMLAGVALPASAADLDLTGTSKYYKVHPQFHPYPEETTAVQSIDRFGPVGVVIHLPGTATDPDVSVARLDFPGALTITQKTFNTPAADGTLTLPALDADPHGAVGGNIRIEGSGADAYLTDWRQYDYRLEYHVKTGKTTQWNIQAEIAAAEPAKLSVRVGTANNTIDIPATGGDMTWKTIPLGTIELPAEEAVLELKPVPDHWKPINLRALKLQP